MIITARSGNVRVTTKLYGTRTPEQLKREYQTCSHRAYQLDTEAVMKAQHKHKQKETGYEDYAHLYDRD